MVHITTAKADNVQNLDPCGVAIIGVTQIPPSLEGRRLTLHGDFGYSFGGLSDDSTTGPPSPLVGVDTLTFDYAF